ncbi:hypothetical protein AB1Y20_019640 [Prymnesium parvum]|uniref:threonine synthase n=1 Tax=Prymnesium parvum TaxID=97485 RepID=A0AB34JUZ9_PRYPA
MAAPPRHTAPSASSSRGVGFRSVLAPPSSPPTSLADATLLGWAADGGMFWPCRAPSPPLREWAALPYAQLCVRLLQLFADEEDAELSRADLARLVGGAFASFAHEQVVPLSRRGAALSVGELWHGPTLAFKDLGMAVLGRTLSHLLRARGERATLLVGTSGDTGSAAMAAVAGLARVEMIVLYPLPPHSSISAVQRRQMAAIAEAAPNVHLIGVEGSSDALDVPIEALFQDQPFKRAHRLGSVNSVNVIRLLVQAAHYFYLYLQLCPQADRQIRFAVPCGAAGHLAAGVLAQCMGLPIQLVGATNSNDALCQLLSRGVLPHAAVQPTLSPSMDIMLPYNCWRLLFVASGGDAAAVRRWQRDAAAGTLRLPAAVVEELRRRVTMETVDDAETMQTMRREYGRDGYMLDPHTAVGVAAALRVARRDSPPAAVPTVCLACAHPIKFLPAVQRAIGLSAAEALQAVNDPTHKWVASVAAMALSVDCTDQAAPYDAHRTILMQGTDWVGILRSHVEAVSALGASRAAAPPPLSGTDHSRL